ncbi:hypothetical protein GCM10010873_28680 [Cypionkella aquatica]|uniref:Uncharacterized protein n=1 Tax=Cypionkella aquatica TaxID=1756042 RepID=A0AA37U591_9RHOB|nr:hypothetical protein GCM10010873_28680 [Cypionkella aquatica]
MVRGHWLRRRLWLRLARGGDPVGGAILPAIEAARIALPGMQLSCRCRIARIGIGDQGFWT